MLRLEKIKKLLKKKGVDVEILMLNDPDYLSKLNDLELKYKKHAAFEQLRFLISRLRDNPIEGLNGIASGRVNDIIHLGPRVKRIAVICLNEDTSRGKVEQILFLDEAIGSIVLDIYPQLKKKLSCSNNPLTNKAMYSLFAKIFAIYHYATENGPAIFKPLVAEQSKQVFRRIIGHSPEENILPAFSGKVVDVLRSMDMRMIDSSKKLDTLVKTIESVMSDIDNRAIISWKNFCGCAQDMAWRGFSPREVLTAAVSGSESPYFQSIGRQLAKNIGVKVSEAPLSEIEFNAFGSEQDNEKRHERKMHRKLLDALGESSKQRESLSFLLEANKQNEEMLEGRFVGWCAKAMQTAGQLFDKLMSDDDKTLQDVQNEVRAMFLETVQEEEYEWNTLKNFSDKIVDEVRDGNIVTYSKAAQIANDNGLGDIADSMNKTLSSPEIQAKLDATKPKAPAAKGPTPKTPELAQTKTQRAAPKMPSLGLGGKSSRRSPSQNTSQFKNPEESVKEKDLETEE